jgi:hypothetical protein
MTVSPGDVVEGGWTVGYLATWHERRGLQIKLAEGFDEHLQDDLGRQFSRSLFYEFDKSALKRVWIPCFVSWELFDFEHNGALHTGQYINIYCVPRDMADRNFRRQYADIFGRMPAEEVVEQFWADISTAVDIFLQYGRDKYERSVWEPRSPRFILFEWRHDAFNGLEDFRKIAASALKLIQEARNG